MAPAFQTHFGLKKATPVRSVPNANTFAKWRFLLGTHHYCMIENITSGLRFKSKIENKPRCKEPPFFV